MFRTVPLVVGTLIAALFARPVWASSGGIARFSGKQTQTCTACHAGGTAPEVRFEGPTEVLAGSTATFRFVLTSEAPSQDEAGLNVAASAGALAVIAGQGTRLLSGEVTHSTPTDIDDDVAAWEFRWTAPAMLGEQTLYGAGNAVNGNGNPEGDHASKTTFTVQVIGGSASPTATATLSANTATATATPSATGTHTLPPTATATTTMASATSTAVATQTYSPVPSATQTETPAPSATATPSPTDVLPTAIATATATGEPGCVGDCDADRRVTVAELVRGVNIALDRASIATCRALDRDGDQRATVAELVEAVSHALQGCGAEEELETTRWPQMNTD